MQHDDPKAWSTGPHHQGLSQLDSGQLGYQSQQPEMDARNRGIVNDWAQRPTAFSDGLRSYSGPQPDLAPPSNQVRMVATPQAWSFTFHSLPWICTTFMAEFWSLERLSLPISMVLMFRVKMRSLLLTHCIPASRLSELRLPLPASSADASASTPHLTVGRAGKGSKLSFPFISSSSVL